MSYRIKSLIPAEHAESQRPPQTFCAVTLVLSCHVSRVFIRLRPPKAYGKALLFRGPRGYRHKFSQKEEKKKGKKTKRSEKVPSYLQHVPTGTLYQVHSSYFRAEKSYDETKVAHTNDSIIKITIIIVLGVISLFRGGAVCCPLHAACIYVYS